MSKQKTINNFNRDIIVGRHFCGKSVRKVSDILQKPKFPVSDVLVVKWKHRSNGTTEERIGNSKVSFESSNRTILKKKFASLR